MSNKTKSQNLITVSNEFKSPKPLVSMAVCIPFSLHFLRSSAVNSGWHSGSPPDTVTPPEDV